MTQQSPLTNNPSSAPGSSARASTSPLGAALHPAASAGPKVLRIGLIQAGRIVEERIVKQRTSVTVGSSEKNMFVISASDLPPTFTLFELAGAEYNLNFTPAMRGRVALGNGVTELSALSSNGARSLGDGVHQVTLGEESRGKVVIGELTFLFQFVAPPPLSPRPQLPVSVTRGATSVDWPTTVIAAFSFLIHFCVIGAMYSDWLDPVVDYDVNVNALVETIRNLPAPPPVEEPEEPAPAEKKPEPEAPKAEPAPKRAEPLPPVSTPGKPVHYTKAQEAGLRNELQSLEMATLAALSGIGPATANVLRGGEVPTSALDAAAASEAGVSGAGTGGLKLRASGGAVGKRELSVTTIGATGKTSATGSGAVALVKGPRGNTSVGDATVAGGAVSDASRVVAQMRAGFRACYNRGLAENPDIEGKIALTIKVGPTGQVASVAASTTGNIPPGVLECVKARATSATFSPPQGGVAVVQVPVSFVKQ